MGKKGKLYLSEGDYDFNFYSSDELLTFTFTEFVNNISSEIKPLQQSIAIMKQDLSKILRDELYLLKGNEY
jgi:hypothetical protein